MDERQFDDLARVIVGPASRRGAPQVLGGAVTAGLVGLAATGSVAAKCKKPCGPCKHCNKGKCKPKPSGASCGDGFRCQGGRCEAACPADWTLPCEACRGDGECFKISDATCQRGRCTCSTNAVYCGDRERGFCVSPNTLCSADPDGRYGACLPDANGVQHADSVCWSWYCSQFEGSADGPWAAASPGKSVTRTRGAFPRRKGSPQRHETRG
jgi:hypothetical protein